VSSTLAIMPHPDDAEFRAGGMLALHTERGERVILAIATDGVLGSFSIPADRLAHRRKAEAEQAATVLGIAQLEWLGRADGGLDGLPAGQLRLEVVRLIRTHRPQRIVSLDPQDRRETHPDHRALSRAVAEALVFSHLPLFDPGAGERHAPHFVAEKFFACDAPADANRFVEISTCIERKLEALLQHRSQVEFLVEDVVRQMAKAGLDPSSILTGASGIPDRSLAAAVRMQAAQAGAAAGRAYAEAFRCVRFHPFVEQLLPEEAGP
jgi:LmbE family N-acetylglucosaminyl deacetylase